MRGLNFLPKPLLNGANNSLTLSGIAGGFCQARWVAFERLDSSSSSPALRRRSRVSGILQQSRQLIDDRDDFWCGAIVLSKLESTTSGKVLRKSRYIKSTGGFVGESRS